MLLTNTAALFGTASAPAPDTNEAFSFAQTLLNGYFYLLLFWIFFLLSVDLCFIRLSHAGKTLFNPIFSAAATPGVAVTLGFCLLRRPTGSLWVGRGGGGGVIKVTVDSVRWSSCVHMRTRLHKYVHG